MTSHPSDPPVSALRERMIEDMFVRGIGAKTRHDYVRHVRTFAAFIGRSPDTTTAEEVRRFQLHQTATGVGAPSINSAVSALRFLFSVTLDRPDLARRLTVVRQPRKLPLVLSAQEVALLLEAAPGPKYKAALATAYGAGLRVAEVVARTITAVQRENDPAEDAVIEEGEVIEALGALEPVWDELYPAEQARILRLLIERIDVAPDGISVTLHAAGIRSLVAELADQNAPALAASEPLLEAAE
jgi:hypothetical protein